MVDADNDSEDEDHHPTSGWDLNRLPPMMSDDDDDSHNDTFTLKEGNAIQCLTIQCLTIQCLMINANDDHATQCFNAKEGNEIQCLTINAKDGNATRSLKATQCFNANDDQNSHHHIATSRISDTRLNREYARPAGRISRMAKVHNKVKQDSKRNTNGDTVETASRVMTRLNGDLRWMWNKLQLKHPVGLTPLRIHKMEEPI
jgi:hypothetical protein